MTIQNNKKLLYPKDFIRQVLIDELQDIVVKHPYLAFLLICSGIEFLGKCIDTNKQEWNWDFQYQKNNPPFDNAIKNLFPEKYEKALGDYKLRDQLRNGLTHALAPKNKIGLSQLKHDENGEITMDNHPFEQGGKLSLIIEYFYIDFVDACKKVLNMNFKKNDKMNKPFLSTQR
jgi:hypothetical protein